MNALIDAAFSRTRTVVIAFLVILVAGAVAYRDIPKESEPEIVIPTIYVAVVQEGIAPEDAARLLVRPLETELQTVEGVEEMRAIAAEGYAAITLEFDAGFDSDAALQEVREAVDDAEPELPADAEEPLVDEVNIALFPVLTAALYGPVPERTLVALADRLEDRIEGLPGVLEVEVAGDREEVLEILIDPTTLETYGIVLEELIRSIERNNRLIAAGALETEAGRIVLKVPGVLEDVEDVMALPVAVRDDTVITFGEVATIRRTFQDPEGFARVNGQPSVALEVSKRPGANILEAVAAVRVIIDEAEEAWPDPVSVAYLQDKSDQVRTTLSDLQNNVLTAILLVMIVIVAVIGPKSAVLVGLAIPGSFLAGMILINALGYTLNIVLLFSLILVVGMLVDGAIVVAELADRHMAEGRRPREAYARAAKRMAWPVISATATTLAVFLPLLFWPGVAGEFMRYIPITVLITLSASLAMALLFVPVLGGAAGGRAGTPPGGGGQRFRDAAEVDDPVAVGGLTGLYLRVLSRLNRRPGLTLLAAIGLTVAAYAAYGQLGRGVEFFPDIEPEFAQIQVQARGNLSVYEKDALIREVERRVMGVRGVDIVYARTLGTGPESRRGADYPEDAVGILQLDLADWDERPPASRILEELRARVADIPGIRIQVREPGAGPATGKPIELEITSRDPAALIDTVERVRERMVALSGFVDVSDSRSPPAVEWQLDVDRGEAARYGADITLLGNAVQMVTRGIPVAEYRPEDADEEVEIRVRFPLATRTLEQLEQMRVPTEQGLVPIGNFVGFRAAPQTGTIERIDGRRALTVSADVEPGLLPAEQLERLRAELAETDLPAGVAVAFAGENEELEETRAFLLRAFALAVFLMVMVLVTQFNSVYQALLVLSAIVFATAGVLLGLLVTGRPFGVVMSGIGVIALAGVVVNNNIVLIDTYNEYRGRGLDAGQAVLRAGAKRLRPVLLTAGTTVLGLTPMVLAMNIDLIGRDIAFGAPSTQWWTQLSSTIAGGLIFATPLTLLLTPCMLVLGERTAARLGRWRGRRQVGEAAAAGRSTAG